MWASQLSFTTCWPDNFDFRLSLSNLMVLRIIKILKGEKHWHKNISNSNLNIFDKDIKLSSAVIEKYIKIPLGSIWLNMIVSFYCPDFNHFPFSLEQTSKYDERKSTFNHLKNKIMIKLVPVDLTPIVKLKWHRDKW